MLKSKTPENWSGSIPHIRSKLICRSAAKFPEFALKWDRSTAENEVDQKDSVGNAHYAVAISIASANSRRVLSGRKNRIDDEDDIGNIPNGIVVGVADHAIAVVIIGPLASADSVERRKRRWKNDYSTGAD